jgi:hypothetical protein
MSANAVCSPTMINVTTVATATAATTSARFTERPFLLGRIFAAPIDEHL